jgi:hypothetical protein
MWPSRCPAGKNLPDTSQEPARWFPDFRGIRPIVNLPNPPEARLFPPLPKPYQAFSQPTQIPRPKVESRERTNHGKKTLEKTILCIKILRH